MTPHLRALIDRHRRTGALLDTNLVLLWVVGAVDPGLLARGRRTASFIPQDYTVLDRLLSLFGRIVTTPNIMTEASNLLGQEAARERLLRRLAEQLESLDEHYIVSRDAAGNPRFTDFGLTDTGIATYARPAQALVLTDDARLWAWLQHEGVDALNFHHIRTAGW